MLVCNFCNEVFGDNEVINGTCPLCGESLVQQREEGYEDTSLIGSLDEDIAYLYEED